MKKITYVAYRNGMPIGFGSLEDCRWSVGNYVMQHQHYAMYTDACIKQVTEEELQQIKKELFIQEYKENRQQGFPARGAIELARMSQQFGFL